ncbi:hypothetical protein [Micromonospora tulbaghiae]|uniref:hypothetical protein n=1 Tax=Micromonospora tulbaghiae TaxID=479978 RepID=UPI003EB70321
MAITEVSDRQIVELRRLMEDHGIDVADLYSGADLRNQATYSLVRQLVEHIVALRDPGRCERET